MSAVAFYRSDRPTRAVDTVIAYSSHYESGSTVALGDRCDERHGKVVIERHVKFVDTRRSLAVDRLVLGTEQGVCAILRKMHVRIIPLPVNLDRFEQDVLERLVVAVRRDGTDRLDDVHSFRHFAKDGVFVIEVRLGVQRNKEL